MAPVVALRAAVALTGRFPALAGVDLAVASGEVVVLEGPNGAGKTSVLRVCAGLLAITGGVAEVLGRDLRRDRARVRRLVGLLGHAPVLYDDLTAVENARFAVRAAGGDPRRVDVALERLGLVGRVRVTPAARLSEGQRRRVELAAIVARRPRLWLLDEAHAGLDVEARAILAEVIEEAVATGASVLATSHDPAGAFRSADRIVSMAGGRVVAEHVPLPRHAPPMAVADPPVVRGGAHVA